MALSKIWTALGGLLGIALLLFLTQGKATVASHLDTDDFIILKPELTAGVMQLGPEYKEDGLFVSEIYETDHSFELLGLNWQQKLPAGTEAGLEIRFRSEKGNWSDWQSIHVDEDAPSQDQAEVEAGYDESLWSYVITEKSTAFQYRANLSTQNKNVTPKLSDISFDYVQGGQSSLLNKFEKMVFDKDQSVVSREEWGANEKLRVASEPNDDFESELDEDDEVEYPDMRIVRTIDENEDGKPLLWPQEYPASVEKIILHHTATTQNLDDPEAAIRAIYYYHAVTRGWGDIGYNFIVAPDGTVYEGRMGGDGVVAGHAQGYNTGSVGIALLGNYEERDLSGDMMQALQALIYKKAKLHDIDPDGTSEFRGDVIPNILGHRDVDSTACPGDYTYDYLDQIRSMVALALENSEAMSSNKMYAYLESGDRDMLVLDPNQEVGVLIKIKNTGTKTWDSKTFLTVDANSESDSLVEIPQDSSKRTALMKESSVKPGGTATFSFKVSAKNNGGLASFDVSPVFNGKEKSTQKMDMAFFVEAPTLDFTVQSSDAPSSLSPGATATVTVTLKNTGNLTWENSGDSAVTLVKNGASSLSDKSTLATLKESEVKPGKTGTFVFSIKAPSKAGNYALYFSPSMKNSNAKAGGSGQIKIKVTESTEKALIVGASSDLNFAPGEEKMLWVQIKNTSGASWPTTGSSAFNLALSKPSGFTIDTPKIILKTIGNEVSTKIYFNVTAPQKAGTYTLSLEPKLGSKNLLSKAYTLSLLVEESATAIQYENPIRIKLTPDNEVGTPILTADSSFSLYSDETFLKTFNAGTRVKITPASDGSFTVSSGLSKWTAKKTSALFLKKKASWKF
ncbi:N-acetylmuramoyl-L-alanine amidase [Candidatus Peregrinibacteria bacterium]|nr:MAG: N-acetylmuramoyl-L-alanine amidase [Candidatus Peregrinibacteria bacterium]